MAEITNIRSILDELEGYDEEKPVIIQVVAQDGAVWSLFGEIHAEAKYAPNFALISLSHPDLLTLPTETQAEAEMDLETLFINAVTKGDEDESNN